MTLCIAESIGPQPITTRVVDDKRSVVARGRVSNDAVHTDIWVSMGEPGGVWDERIALLTPYQVDRER